MGLRSDPLLVQLLRVRFAQKLKSDSMFLHIHRLQEVRPSTKMSRWTKTPTDPFSKRVRMVPSPGSAPSPFSIGLFAQLFYLFCQGMIVTTPHVDPWMHPSFVPLQDVVIRGLRQVNAIEMPSRHLFDETLSKFLASLSPELRDTATFTVETYSDIARAISESRISSLATRQQLWVTCHHARSGSAKRHLILLPRDAFYHMNREDEEKLRLNYILQADGEENSEGAKKLAENGLSPAQSAAVFERVPVQNQIYDVLVYTHRNHGSSSTMLFEARRIGVVSISKAYLLRVHG